MRKPMQLRFALVLLALYKAGEDDACPAVSAGHRWIWDLFQGPVGAELATFSAESLQSPSNGDTSPKVVP
jgi:hypothetical protein